MRARNTAKPLVSAAQEPIANARPAAVPAPTPVSNPNALPTLPVLCQPPFRNEAQPRRFARVPTHAVGVHPEHREYPRAALRLPLRLRSVNNVPEEFPVTLVTRDISSTGVYFLSPKQLDAGSFLELEIVLVSRPMGRGNVVLTTRAHVLRHEPAAVPGWFGIAASFDDVQFDRDDHMPSRFLKP
jgi:PilZ domain